MTTPLPGSQIALGGLVFGAVEPGGVVWGINPDGVSGWGSPASTVQVVNRVRSDGGWAGPSWLTPRVLAITGWVSAPTLGALTDARDRLAAACTLALSPMVITEAGVSRTVYVRRQGELLFANTSDTAATWSISVVAPDPRKFGSPIVAITPLPSVTGGLTYPVTYPRTYTAVQITGVITITNPGNTAGKLTMRIDGPCTGPSITHIGSGATLTFASSLTINTGDWLDIDMENRNILANGQSRRNNTVTSRSWFSLDPGVNQFAFGASVYNSGALLTITGTPAYQ